ncbi:MAG TPA: hypothetical protein VGK45_11455 [Thermoanaerobaculia bacterium]
MKSFILVFTGVVALALSGRSAMACSCLSTPPFSEAAPKGDLVIVGVVLSYHENAMQVQVDRVLKGIEERKTITVWGDDGTQCRPNVSNFPPTTKWVFTLFRSGEKITLAPPAAGRPYYELSSCGRYWLQVQGNEATGKINGEEDETVPLFDVIRWLVEGAKSPLGRKK